MLRFRSSLASTVLAFALFTPLRAPAQFGMPLGREDTHAQPARIRELVAQYCRLDYEGARLDPETWKKLQPLVSWRENADFPLIDVISRFTLDEQPTQERSKYLIRAHYRLLGRFTLGEAFSKESAGSTEDVMFTVTQGSGDWRVSDAEPNYPHVSRTAMLKWLNENLAKAKDATAKTIYQNAIDQLQTPAPVPVQ
jgi:hypothetical protein